MMFWGWHTGVADWAWPLVGTLVWLVVIGLVVVIVARLLSGPRGPDRYWSPPPPPSRPDDPEEILRGRYRAG